MVAHLLIVAGGSDNRGVAGCWEPVLRSANVRITIHLSSADLSQRAKGVQGLGCPLTTPFCKKKFELAILTSDVS